MSSIKVHTYSVIKEVFGEEHPEISSWTPAEFKEKLGVNPVFPLEQLRLDQTYVMANFFDEDHPTFIDMIVGYIAPRSCRRCGCTDDDCRVCIEKTGGACYWVSSNLCSACTNKIIVNP